MAKSPGDTGRARIYSILGGLVTLAALAFVIERLWSLRLQILDRVEIRQLVVIILAGSIVYIMDNLFLVFAWRHLVEWLGGTGLSWRVALSIYGRTQIAKYLPGNVFQFPSRHFLGRQFDLDHKVLLGAAVFEVIGLLITASLVALFGLFMFQREIASQSFAWPLLILLFGTISPLFLHIAFSRSPFLQKFNTLPGTIRATYRGLLPTWFMYLLFFLFAGAILYGVMYSLGGSSTNAPLPLVVSAYAVAWLAGTITPGAPGGAGIREAALILTLSTLLGEPLSVVVAFTTRIATILGDIYTYLVARVVLRF